MKSMWDCESVKMLRKIVVGSIVALTSTVAEAQVSIFLLCSDETIGVDSTVSIRTESGELVFQEDSVILKNGVIDQFGGTPRISITASQIRVEYANPTKKFSSTWIIDRVTGRIRSSSTDSDGKTVWHSGHCKPASQKF
jgi:hypothetical protein